MNILRHPSLKAYNTFGIDVHAPALVSIESIGDLEKSYALKEFEYTHKLPLGGGSNILFTKDFDGLILKMDIPGIDIVEENEVNVWVKVGAGVVWHEFVLFCIAKGWSGVENLSLIPGNVGAAPMQNIGAYGVEIKDVFEELEAWLTDENKLKTFNKNECAFGYRMSVFKSVFKNRAIITSVTFKLNKNAKINTSYGAIEAELHKAKISKPTIKDISDAVIRIRQSKLPDPKKIGNAGSFFKNPIIPSTQFEDLIKAHPNLPSYKISDNEVKLPAGWLIEQAGWKGKTIDDRFGVHKKQALVLVNYTNASGKEILRLSSEIIQSIDDRYGIKLEREVNIL